MPFGLRPFRSRFGNLSQDRDEPMFPPLPPEEEEGILSSVYRTGLSSLGWLGEALDKPGSAVRGLLAGKPDQLLNLIPFSDTAGWTNPETRVSGRDLLEKGGLVGPNQEGLDWGDVAGFGASVLLDPLLYASFGTSGALTAAGQAAAKSGTLAKTMAGRIGSGQAGLMSLGVPWPISRYAPDAYITLGKGPWAEKFAEVLGKVGGKVQTLPVARELRGLFDSSAGNTADAALQRLNAEEVEPLRQSLREEALGLHAEALRRAEAGGFFNNRAVEDTMRDAIERNVSPTGIPLAPEHVPAAQLGHWAKGHMDDVWRDAKEMGVPIGWLEKHFPRGMAPMPGDEREFLKAAAAQQAAAKPFHPSMLGREEIFQGPSRTLLTEEIEKGLLQDPFLSGPGRLAPTDAAAAVHIRQNLLGNPLPPTKAQLKEAARAEKLAAKYGDPLWQTSWANKAVLHAKARGLSDAEALQAGKQAQALAALYGTKHVSQAEAAKGAVDAARQGFADATKQAEGLANWAGAQSARHLDEGHPFFNPPITDFKNYMVGMADTRSAAHGVLEFLKQSARPAKAGDLHITDAVKQVGLESQGAAALLKRIPGATADSHTIPKEAVEAATRYLAPFQSPEALKPIVGAVDYFTNMFRKLSYSSWPASWMRNAIGVIWQNYVAGAIDKAAPIGMGLYRPLKDAWDFMHGKSIGDLAKAPAFARMGIQSDDEATRILADVLYKTEAAGPGASSSADALVTGPLGQPVSRAQHIMPGSKEAADLPDFTRAIPRSKEDVGKYLKIHKVGGAGSVKTEQPWIAEGERMVRMVDQAGRISAATAFVKQGYDLEVAARMAKAVHYDYSALSNFEKHVMRRVIPFYCVPDDCEILSRRGWLTVDQLQVGEEVLAMNHDTGESEWTTCQDKAIFPYDGTLMSLGGEREEFLFTPDHRWPVVAGSKSVGKKARKSREIRRGYQLRSSHVIPRTSEFRGEESVATPREAAIVGWVVTDGYQRSRGSHLEMVIYQSPHKHLEEIVALLGDGGSVGKPHPGSGVVPVRLVGELRRRISELIPTKSKIIEFVCHLSREAAESCLDAMKKAEGCSCGQYSKTGYRNFFAQNDGPVLDAFQILSQLCGEVAHKCKRGAYTSEKYRVKKVAGAIGYRWYRGRVWCPQTKHGTWLMRRGGRVIWTGNTFSRHNLPYQLKQLVNNPAKTAEAIRFGQELGPDEQYVPEYLRGGTAIPIGDRTEDGHQTFLSQFGLPFEEAFGRVHPGSPLRTVEEYLGTTNPMIKGPLEMLTGRQFYSGRELGELYGPTEALGLPPSTPVDQLIMNSPLTRMYTSAQTIMNPNKTIPSKAVNLLSGVRMTDVDVEKQKGIEGRKLLDQLLKEDPAIKQFQRYYVPQENLPELTPHNALLMRLESTLAQRAKAEALKRKAEMGDQEAARQLAALRARMGG